MPGANAAERGGRAEAQRLRRYRHTRCRSKPGATGKPSEDLRNVSETESTIMKSKTVDAAQVWKDFEDGLAPRLPVFERAVYSHLLRHSLLEGRAQLRFSILWLSRSAGLTQWSARLGVRRLVAKGALRLIERSKRGHWIEVHLPGEIRGLRKEKSAGEGRARLRGTESIEETDFLGTREGREAIHAREGERCFYCRRRLKAATRCLDHVIPVVRAGRNTYRNLVSACSECNSRKGEWEAKDFLRWLYREGRLTARELSERLGALERLAAGKLRPARLGDGRVREKDAPKPGSWKEISGWPGKLERKNRAGALR